MFSTLALAQFGKWLLSKLTLRNILTLIAVALLVYGGFKGYNWIFDRGVAHQVSVDKPIIEKLTEERDEADRQYKRYKSTYDQFVLDTKTANQKLIDGNQVVVDRLTAELEEAKRSAGSKTGNKPGDLNHDIPKYIPPTADAACAVPVGLVSLWNESLEGRGTGDRAPGNGISFGLTGDAGRASGLTLSQFGGLFVQTNAEAVYRGVIIRKWQTWYVENKALFDEAQRKKAEQIPQLEGSDG